MKFVAQVRVTLKDSILDPQGRTIGRTLKKLGHDTVREVRTGRLISLELEGGREQVEAQLSEYARNLLANPLTENVEWELSEAGA